MDSSPGKKSNHRHRRAQEIFRKAREEDDSARKMPVMEKLRMFVAQEPVVAASLLIGGVGLFLPAVVRPILDSLEASKQVKPPPLTDVIAGVTGKKQSS